MGPCPVLRIEAERLRDCNGDCHGEMDVDSDAVRGHERDEQHAGEGRRRQDAR